MFQSLYEVEITYINNELVEVEQYLMVLKPGLTDRFEMTSLRVLRRMTQSNPLSVQCKIGYVVSRPRRADPLLLRKVRESVKTPLSDSTLPTGTLAAVKVAEELKLPAAVII